jgi:hypothetical protein
MTCQKGLEAGFKAKSIWHQDTFHTMVLSPCAGQEYTGGAVASGVKTVFSVTGPDAFHPPAAACQSS